MIDRPGVAGASAAKAESSLPSAARCGFGGPRKLFALAPTLLIAACIGCDKPAPKSGAAVPAKNPSSEETEVPLNPKFPIVEGKYQMSKNWSITLPSQFNRRIEDKSLVLWRPGITAWIIVWNNDKNQSSEERLAIFRKGASPEAFESEELKDGEILRFGYRLTEKRPDSVVHAYYGFAFNASGHVQLAVYFDKESDLKLAKGLWRSLRE